MKTTYGTILVFVMATAILLSTPVPCWAAEKKGENIWREGESKWGHRRWELTDEKIEHIMNRLAKSNPERAEELKKLREKSEEKFKAELRRVMRERFGRKHREQREQKAGRRPRRGMRYMPGMGHGRGRPGIGAGMHGVKEGMGMRMGMNMQERHAEYLKWLEKNYPEKAEELAELREENPELYMRKLWHSHKKYRRIAEAEKENPELAQVLKEDLEIKNRRDKLLRKIRAADADERRELVKELEGAVGSRFDLIVRRKQIKYEQLLKRLERLKQKVEESEAEVEKWKDAKFKKENVKARIEELVSGTEQFKWD